MRISRRWQARSGLAAAVAAAVGLAAGAATAHASSLTQAQKQLRSMRSLVAPMPSSTTPSPSSLELRTAPVDVTINSTRYSMVVDIVRPTGFVPELDVSLSRVSGSAAQGHDYLFAPNSGFSFTGHFSALSSASVDSGSSINPSALAMTYTASAPQATSSCTLQNGHTGHFRRSSGTVSASTFSIVTPTSPFFGTITTPATRATLLYDPGCAGGKRPKYPPCDGRETIQSTRFGASSAEIAVADVGFRGTHMTGEQLDATFSNVALTDHDAFAILPGSNVGGTRKSHRAWAYWKTPGDPFMSGEAIFTSHSKPVVRTNKACSYEGHVRHFDSWRYSGTLAPYSPSPLTALFDTGTKPFASHGGTVTFRRYLK